MFLKNSCKKCSGTCVDDNGNTCKRCESSGAEPKNKDYRKLVIKKIKKLLKELE